MVQDETRSTPEARLRDIQALTDSSLGLLAVEELLDAVLDRVVEILEADTSAVLLLEPGAPYLVARAARGLEEEVRQGVRVPLGRGFAGRIAAEMRPVTIDRVDATTVTNPILWNKGVRSMLGVPLLSGGAVLGVLHVGSLEDRTFTEADIQLLQLAGDRIAAGLQTRLSGSERAAAAMLQRSLLPTEFPDCPGLEFAARYVPAEGAQVGGDWYDGFMLPSGQVWLVAGDVAGHGLRAAVVMARVRTAIRAYALEGHPPEEVLRLTDQKLLQFDPGELATALCVTTEPPYTDVVMASAGHPPPLLANPDGPGWYPDLDVAPPLGTGYVSAIRPTAAVLARGCVLLAYTDGLVERRRETVDWGFDLLREAVGCEDPEAVCRRVMDTLVGSRLADDDIAVAVMRRIPED